MRVFKCECCNKEFKPQHKKFLYPSKAIEVTCKLCPKCTLVVWQDRDLELSTQDDTDLTLSMYIE